MVKMVLLCPFWRKEHQDLRPLNTSMGTHVRKLRPSLRAMAQLPIIFSPLPWNPNSVGGRVLVLGLSRPRKPTPEPWAPPCPAGPIHPWIEASWAFF